MIILDGHLTQVLILRVVYGLCKKEKEKRRSVNTLENAYTAEIRLKGGPPARLFSCSACVVEEPVC